MKALSLWQPWASLIAIGAKRIETRSWDTLYRGPVAIHAAKKWDKRLMEIARSFAFDTTLRPKSLAVDRSGVTALPFGCIVATGRLVRVERITFGYVRHLDPLEAEFGDYTPGRFAFHFEDVRALQTPIPYRGAQGLFELLTWANARITRGGVE